MWQLILAENVFRGDRIKLEGQRITFTATREAEIKSGRVVIEVKHGAQHKTLRLIPGATLYVWYETR